MTTRSRGCAIEPSRFSPSSIIRRRRRDRMMRSSSSSGLSNRLPTKALLPTEGENNMRHRRFYSNLLTIVLGCGLSLLVSGCIYNISLFPQPGALEEKVVEGSGKDKVLLLDISGVI